MASLIESTRICFERNFGLKRGESVLIVTDENLRDIAGAFLEAAKAMTTEVNACSILVGKRSGEEPPVDVAEEMENNDVVLCITTKSLTHTNARISACEKGARVATMAGITEEMISRTFDVDYNEVVKENEKIAKMIEKGKEMHVVSAGGSDLRFSIEDVKICGVRGGLLFEKGRYGNLPDGEVFFAPVKGSAEGVYVVDASHSGVGKVDDPITVEVLHGYAVKITGGVEADRLNNMLKNVCDKNAFNIAEFGIGTNPNAIVTGNVLEDEKVKGTCHIALGSNFAFGGDVKVDIHVDGVIMEPDIFIDGVKVVGNGKLL